MSETETDGVSRAHCLPQSERSLFCPHAVYIVVTEEEVNRDKRDARGEGREGEREGKSRGWGGELISEKFKWSDEKKLEGRAGRDKTGFRVGEKEKEGERSVTLKHRGERWKYHPKP